jgi:serine/threonine protein kinase
MTPSSPPYNNTPRRHLTPPSLPSYRAFDCEAGIEVAWNVVNTARMTAAERERIFDEIQTLRDLHHDNIIKLLEFYDDSEHNQV